MALKNISFDFSMSRYYQIVLLWIKFWPENYYDLQSMFSDYQVTSFNKERVNDYWLKKDKLVTII